MLVAIGGLKLATEVNRLFHCPVANGCAAGYFYFRTGPGTDYHQSVHSVYHRERSDRVFMGR